MAFNIVDCENGVLVRFQRKPGIAEFPTAPRAAKYAKKRGEKDGRKYKIKQAVADDFQWIVREQARMNDGTYVQVPFANESWFWSGTGRYPLCDIRHRPDLVAVHNVIKTHFPHVSMANKSMLAFTESREKGARDIQTQIKPGAYLAKYFSSYLSTSDIQYHVNEWQRRFAECELKFARTPEDIVRVYQNGPRSCMSGTAEEYSTDTKGGWLHPCMVYGQPHSDLTLAYYEGKHGISARVLVWEAKKQYGRIYGDSVLLLRELKAMGYVANDFKGAKIGKIVVGPARRPSFLMPYIDGWSQLIEQDDHFLLSTGDHLPREEQRKIKWHCCSNTHGLSGNPRYVCKECNEDVDGEDICRIPQFGMYCRECYERDFIYCERLGSHQCREGSERVVALRRECSGGRIEYQTRLWSERAIESHAFRCPIDGELHSNELSVIEDGVKISRRAYETKHPPVAPAANPTPQPAAGWSFRINNNF